MPLSTQVRLLRAMREILAGDVSTAFSHASSEPKPLFEESLPSLPLPRSTPEAEGLGSHKVEAFYRDLAGSPLSNAHALMMVRHGKVISEGYFAPYRKGVWHVTHSLCKTFTGTAVGLATSEGLFKLDDTIASFFPEKVGLLASKQMRSITVRHLLTMTSGISYNEISEAVESDWLKGIFASSVSFEPGTKFNYNSMNSYLLSALVQKTSGQSVLEYLAPRVLQPMGFGPIAWEKSGEDIDKGGWGMYITLEDMAKFGQLYLQKGMWEIDGKPVQLIPRGWVEQATQVHARGDNGEEYGYQLWVESTGGSFIMNGMFGQYITVLPQQDMVLAMNSGTPFVFTDSPGHRLVRERFYGTQFPASLPADPYALNSLRTTLASLRFGKPAPAIQRASVHARPLGRTARWQNLVRQVSPLPLLDAFIDTTWSFEKNPGGILPMILQFMNNNFSTGIRALRFEPYGSDGLLMLWEEENATVCLPIGLNRALESELLMGSEHFLVACSAVLRQDADEEDVLCIDIAILEHSSSRHIKCKRKGEGIEVWMDEQPSLTVAIQTVVAQNQSTGAAPRKGEKRSTNPLLNSEYVNYRLEQLCVPHVVGTPYKEPPYGQLSNRE